MSELTTRSGRVRAARRLGTRRGRDDSGEFLAEGPQAVREALRTGNALEVFATASAAAKHPDLRASAGPTPWHVVDQAVVDAIADTVTPQGVVARCRVPPSSLGDLFGRPAQLVAILVDVRDPGNAGTVIRSADAAGADGVVLAGASVDPYNPKAVRASVGSHFHLDVVVSDDVATTVTAARAAGLQVLATDGTASLDLVAAAQTGLLDAPTAWLFGNEAHGLRPAVSALADRVVAIPVYGSAESLNLATAVAVCLYASAVAQRVGAATREPGNR